MNPSQYFDYAAATPLLPEAKTAMEPYLTGSFFNASALYTGGRSNRYALETARHTVAMGLGAKPTELIFTAGGTEANNIAIHGVMSSHPGAKIVVSAIEHESVLEPAKNYPHEIVDVNEAGIVDITALKGAITDDVVLVSVMYANNEVGSIQPLNDIFEVIAAVRNDRKQKGITLPLFLHTDACQAGNYLDIQVSRLHVDLLTINAGKVYGPKQTGALYVRSGIHINPLIQGGGQEWNIRSGTENIANIVAFATAWQAVRADYKQERERLTEIRDAMIATLTKALPKLILNGATQHKRLANNIHITIPGYDNERLLMELDEAGFMVATGSACSASSDEPSHVLKAMGLSDEAAQSSLRITLGRYTTNASAEACAQKLISLVQK